MTTFYVQFASGREILSILCDTSEDAVKAAKWLHPSERIVIVRMNDD